MPRDSIAMDRRGRGGRDEFIFNGCASEIPTALTPRKPELIGPTHVSDFPGHKCGFCAVVFIHSDQYVDGRAGRPHPSGLPKFFLYPN
jgi:hypothetical protein